MLIDISTFQLLKKAINNDGGLELPASGTSMFPFIKQGNLCRFIPVDRSTLVKKGDILLFHSHENQLIAHRFVGINTIDNKLFFLLKGDTNLGCDLPIEQDRILGKLVKVQKKRVTISPDQIIMTLWGKMVLSFPVLSGILRRYLNSRFYHFGVARYEGTD